MRPRQAAAGMVTFSLGRRTWSRRYPGLRLSLRDCTSPWAGIARPFQGLSSLEAYSGSFTSAMNNWLV